MAIDDEDKAAFWCILRLAEGGNLWAEVPGGGSINRFRPENTVPPLRRLAAALGIEDEEMRAYVEGRNAIDRAGRTVQ